MAGSSSWTKYSLLYTSINIRKIKFIAYIYIPFKQNLEEKSYISAKIDTVKHLHAASSNCGTAPMSSQIVESYVCLTSLTSHGSMLLE